jgi:gluconokinase
MSPTAVIVMGVAGSGKSTVGTLLAAQLGWTYAEGDSFHSAANVAKMAAGHPLTDEDRAPWLAAIRDWIAGEFKDGKSCVVACSALRRQYRDVIRSASNGANGVVRFAYLEVDRALLYDRLMARHSHYMHVNMLDSQLATLEPPAADENPISARLTETSTPSAAAQEIATKLNSATTR